jgi:FixJ family two-component response regulator
MHPHLGEVCPQGLVAGDLGISEITVKAHRGKVMRKMMATSLPDLARTADKIGLNPFIQA